MPCTAEQKQRFLDALGETGIAIAACEESGLPHMTAYWHRQRDAEFAKAWADALEQSTQRLEASVYRRAMDKDTLLAMFMLKARRPDVYREKETVHTGPNTVNIAYINEWRGPLSASVSPEPETLDVVSTPALEAELDEPRSEQ
jgi:hypothetical protein